MVGRSAYQIFLFFHFSNKSCSFQKRLYWVIWFFSIIVLWRGKGLGKNENGIRDFIKVSQKKDNLGVKINNEKISSFIDQNQLKKLSLNLSLGQLHIQSVILTGGILSTLLHSTDFKSSPQMRFLSYFLSFCWIWIDISFCVCMCWRIGIKETKICCQQKESQKKNSYLNGLFVKAEEEYVSEDTKYLQWRRVRIFLTFLWWLKTIQIITHLSDEIQNEWRWVVVQSLWRKTIETKRARKIGTCKETRL